MLVIPAIDLKDGQCVRLRQGDMDDSTVFSDDPVATAAQWAQSGARRLHMVDLNGAFAGTPKNASCGQGYHGGFTQPAGSNRWWD
jgi:phosphoribosylformimino-5-aminoimidazole carboxamide ribotide isomerase